MKPLTIPVNVPPDILVLLNETQEEIQNRFQAGIAMMLFQEEKLTIGKAVEMSGLSRFKFEQLLSKLHIKAPQLSADEVFKDGGKL